MRENEKKGKRRIFLVVVFVLIIIGVICGLLSGGLLKLGRIAMDKMEVTEKITEKIEAGELPEKIELPPEVEEELSSFATESETESESESETVEEGQQSAQSQGTVDYSQGIDLSYASAIASVASGADIALAYNTVLGCLSTADKVQIASYLKNGQEGAAYNLVASRLTGSAYATLAGLYYKYLPMVQ